MIGAVSGLSEVRVAKESRKGRLHGLIEICGLRPHQLHRNRALETLRQRRCNAVQGGDTQGNRGATDRNESVRSEGASSEEAEGEEEKPPVKEESATEKLLREMREKAEEQARKDKEANLLYKYGQREYGRGEYAKAVEALQSAVDLVAKGSALGGEMQIWLAMAFDANGQRADGLAMYRKLEATHPMKAIKLQAANLRYIMEAPRLKISKDERVTIPLVGEESQTGKPSFTELYKEKRRANYRKTRKLEPDIWDRIEWKPPRWQKNPYVWVAFTLWLTLIAVTMAFGD
ncbi:hypothetical protein KFL_002350070 [Klebsormidium nitens]|uniref:Uncharacterized protein n=1 Tax=Klebsormidium nitens TaxID=105231 RepID=A0A1Y1I652_KLENI|nr:hypothetical protein KFL_002350070 [Klebsormidium nitens]|eukprot:GAQ85432.1 hypothetical protein KFL_002350070 [Klebsormidium nitens]